MNIVFATDDNYAKPTLLAIASVLICNKQEKIDFYILTEHLNNKNKKLFTEISKSLFPKSTITFLELTKKMTEQFIPTIKENNHVSVATYFRLFIPSLLPPDIHKVLYLDGDILCVGKLDKLYESELNGFSMAATLDERTTAPECFLRLDYPMENGYAGAGVLLINLDWWREHSVQKLASKYISQFPEKCLWHDQDALNKILNGTIKFVNLKYNVYEQLYIGTSQYPASMKKETEEAMLEPVLLHFSDFRKPWQKESKSPFRFLWRKFYKKVFGKKCRLSHKYKGKICILWIVKKFLNFTGIKKYSEFRKYPEYEQVIRKTEKKLMKEEN